jgi:hypothetical protein
MVLKSLVAVPLLATTLFAPVRCEAEGVDANPYTGHFHADRVAFISPTPDYHCVHGVVGRFELDGESFAVIDFECDNTVDAVRREDGLLILVVPEGSGRTAGDFDPLTDIDWSALIDDESPSPFIGMHTGEWMRRHALHALEHGDRFQQHIDIGDWSVDEWTADITLASSSDLERIDPQEHALAYRWFTATDDRSGTECWSVRVRGEMTNVMRWLIANGVHEIRTMHRMMDVICRWIPERRVVECRRGGVLLATIDVHM